MSNSLTCQQAKHENCKIPGLLQPLAIPTSWQNISLDFIEGQPNSKGYTVILVVVDRFTKYSHFNSMRHPFTAGSLTRLFLQQVTRLHGLPHSIVSDHDKFFTSILWQELFKGWKITLATSSAYHP